MIEFFIGVSTGFLLGCAWASSVVRRQMFEAARERGRLP